MARMRSIKPEFWVDRKLARSLTRDERMLYLALWNQADEWGRLQADPRLVKGQTFPYDDDVTLEVLDAWIDHLDAAGVALRYEVHGDPYLVLPNLAKHQRLEPNKVPSRLPEPGADTFARRADLSEPRADKSAREVMSNSGQDTKQVAELQEQSRANTSAPDSNRSARGANSSALKQVAGSREQVAGQPSADESAQSEPDPFDTFWAAYPRKVEKADARKAWRAALKKTTASELIDAVTAYPFSNEPRYIKHAATWLNKGCWADEPSTVQPAAGDLSKLSPRERAEAEGREYKAWEDY